MDGLTIYADDKRKHMDGELLPSLPSRVKDSTWAGYAHEPEAALALYNRDRARRSR